MQERVQKSNRKTITILVMVACFMFGFCFALVPLYNTFCKLTGLQGKTSGERIRIDSFVTVDTSRTITVEFVSQVMSDLPWDFYPKTKQVRVHPGQMKRVEFFAKNRSRRDITGQAIPSVSPGLASLYFKKTECFCFKQQDLHHGESANMPLVFFIDKDLPKDIKRLTLSYTLFDASKNKVTKTDFT